MRKSYPHVSLLDSVLGVLIYKYMKSKIFMFYPLTTNVCTHIKSVKSKIVTSVSRSDKKKPGRQYKLTPLTMKERIRHYGQAVGVVLAALTVLWAFMWFDGQHNSIPFVSPAQASITATSTAEFNLSGIEKKGKLKDRIEVMIEKTRAKQKKRKAEKKLQKLQRQETSLE